MGGCRGNGDIFIGENIKEFQKYVLDNLEGGVHFVMAEEHFPLKVRKIFKKFYQNSYIYVNFLLLLVSYV